MRRLRGKNAGQKLTPHQYCNDWISAIDPQLHTVIVRPTAVQLDPEDWPFFAGRDPEHPHHMREFSGTFWQEYQLHDDGRFTRLFRDVTERTGLQ